MADLIKQRKELASLKTKDMKLSNQSVKRKVWTGKEKKSISSEVQIYHTRHQKNCMGQGPQLVVETVLQRRNFGAA